MEIINNEYFEKCKKAYSKLVKDAIIEADKEYNEENVPKSKRDYGVWIQNIENDLNTMGVVGYYLVNTLENTTPYEHWHENTYYLFENNIATEQDKEVEKILKIHSNIYDKKHIILRDEDIKNGTNGTKFHLTVHRISCYELVIKDYKKYIITEMRKVLEKNPEKNTIEYFLPDIYVQLENMDCKIEPKVEIQTTSYGCLDIESYNNFLEAQNKGKIIAKYILETIILPLANELSINRS